MTETNQLLRDYVSNGSEAAFRELVGRYMNLVYSVAVRRVGGDAHLAQDVVQTVFTDLAAKARLLPANVTLGGWLHRHACFVSSSLLRAERRWQTREREAVEMNSLNAPETIWMKLAPMLDEAIDQLGAADREAVLLRYFEQQDLRSVGTALGISEDAAQKRVTRAVEKLREIVSQQGVTLSAALLAGALTANAVSAAPSGLVSTVSAAALAAVAAGISGTGGLLQLLAAAKFKLALAAGIIAAVSLPFMLRQTVKNGARDNQRETASQAVDPTKIPAKFSETSAALALTGNGSTNTTGVESGLLKLIIVAADSGKPVPIVPIEYRRWEGGEFQGRTLQANRFGVCEVRFPAGTTTDLQLTTRIDGFADTRLQWRMDRGEQIPTNYMLRLTRPVVIGGKVVDADGQLVADAKVGWNHETDVDAETRPESHAFSWIEVTTDAEGRWRINRIAPEMIRRLYGSAKHTEHVGSGLIFTAREPEAEKQLLAEKHVFHLGRGISIRGVVLDAGGQPVEGAEVLLGTRGMSDRRETKSNGDGTFSLAGCKPGKNLLSAEAKGFAATTIEVDVTADSELFQLTLQRGRILRLRVVNQADQPVPKVYVWLNTFDRRSNSGRAASPAPIQADFSPRTDADGRAVWSNAPAAELSFDVSAKGHMRVDGVKIAADGEEHIIKLPPALVVSGTVRDKATGELVPRFRIGTGWPSSNFDGTTGTQWSTIDRFWISFAGGKYRHSYEEGVISGTANRGYVLKFEAEGYAPFISRVIAADEGEVTLEVKLKAASVTTVTVLQPDGALAIGADVGFVSPGARLSLSPGGFSRQNVQSGGSLRATDGEGKFQLPADEAINRVIAAGPAGYVEVPRAALAENPIMQLQPWGRIEGMYSSGGQPAADREFLLQYAQGSPGRSDVL